MIHGKGGGGGMELTVSLTFKNNLGFSSNFKGGMFHCSEFDFDLTGIGSKVHTLLE